MNWGNSYFYKRSVDFTVLMLRSGMVFQEVVFVFCLNFYKFGPEHVTEILKIKPDCIISLNQIEQFSKPRIYRG